MREFPVVFYREGDFWLAKALGLGVSTFGESLDDARSAIREAIELYLEDGDQQEPLQPGDIRIETVSVLI